MPTRAEIEHLKLKVEEANSDIACADAIVELLEDFDGSDTEKETYINRLFQLANTTGLTSYKAWAELFLSARYYNMEGQQKARELIDNAFKVFLPLYDLKGISAAYMGYGLLERACEQFTAALEYYFKAVEIREETGYKDLIRSFFFIGHAYHDTSNADLSIAYFEKALALAEKAGDK